MISHKDLAPERQQRLRSIIRQEAAVRVDDLCDRLKVSPATVRRDLEELEQQGVIRRVHGGAVSVETRLDEPLFDDKTSIAAVEKKTIGKTAAAMIESGDTVYLDGGSTVLELTRAIRSRTDITVVTNSLRAAVELSGSGPEVIIIGGHLRRRSQTVVGTLTRLILDQIHVDKAFMGTIGFTPETGMTTTDADEAFTKEQIMDKAGRVILLADSGKAGQVSFARSGGIEDIDVIISDSGISKTMRKSLADKHIELITI